MFHFPPFALHDYVFIMQYLYKKVGFPIQTPPDHSSFASSPKLFAGYHVFHRLLLPRHSPCALTILVIYPKIAYLLFVNHFLRNFLTKQLSTVVDFVYSLWLHRLKY